MPTSPAPPPPRGGKHGRAVWVGGEFRRLPRGGETRQSRVGGGRVPPRPRGRRKKLLCPILFIFHRIQGKELINLLLIPLILGLSIDALAVGLSLGLGRIRITPAAGCAILFLSSAVSGVSLLLGGVLTLLFPTSIAQVLGACILLIMGVWMFLSALVEECARYRTAHGKSATLLRLAVPSLGVTLCVLHDPVTGDRNRSGDIDLLESIPIATALCLDVVGAGVGMGALGVSWWLLPLCIGPCQLALLLLGNFMGHRGRSGGMLGRIGGFFAGTVLMVLAILRLI